MNHTNYRTGSLTILSLGEVIWNNPKFHTKENIFPRGFRTVRRYWSFKDCQQRSDFRCEVLLRESDKVPIYKITPQEDLRRTITSTSIDEAWRQLIERINKARTRQNMDPIFVPYRVEHNALHFFGLSEPWVIKLIEEIPEASRCYNYSFRFAPTGLVTKHRHYLEQQGIDLRLPLNPSGSARSDPFQPSPVHHELGFATADYIEDNFHFSNAALNPFEANFAVRYRQLGTKLGRLRVIRSPIHQWGLAVTESIAEGELVIEYVGQIIRTNVAIKRDKIYQAKKLGNYMFKLSDAEVIDGTKEGNKARFINHSCEVNEILF